VTSAPRQLHQQGTARANETNDSEDWTQVMKKKLKPAPVLGQEMEMTTENVSSAKELSTLPSTETEPIATVEPQVVEKRALEPAPTTLLVTALEEQTESKDFPTLDAEVEEERRDRLDIALEDEVSFLQSKLRLLELELEAKDQLMEQE